MAGERSLLSEERLLGTIIDWKGKFGWIQPMSPINHPQASKHGGRVYLAVVDVEEELEGVGATVSFTAYVDNSGIGAMSVRPASATEAEQAAGAATQATGNGWWGSSDYANRGGNRHWGSKGSKAGGKAAGKSGGKAAAPIDPSELPERLHNALNNGIWRAIKNLTTPDAEWGESEMTKRIVKYFYKAGQSPDLLTVPWPSAVQQFVEHAMQGYSAACGDRPWFFELDLSQALCAAMWEVVRANSCQPRALYPEMEQMTTGRYEETMDSILTDKAMWDASSAVFGEEPVSNKVYKALKVAHEASFTEACADPRPIPDQQRVEMFMGRWMENSMGRAWQSIENSEFLLAPDTISRLFGSLVAPFGDDHPFSCIPAVLTQNVGRPPSGWAFVWHTAEHLFNSWVDPVLAQVSGAKRRKVVGKKWKYSDDAFGALVDAAEAEVHEF